MTRSAVPAIGGLAAVVLLVVLGTLLAVAVDAPAPAPVAAAPDRSAPVVRSPDTAGADPWRRELRPNPPAARAPAVGPGVPAVSVPLATQRPYAPAPTHTPAPTVPPAYAAAVPPDPRRAR